ncbi:ComEA family DNA-binding protein [Alienimonas chondri]|uniref:Helix-hairpin-helix domain-containing protein n=1 Tax=Alienimonas chondri TaxID=2681879 RepID=A0ABX1VJ52_9PLAN|nr:helix-hairpin-helix domain-containing protein [Alienimonas chondri]NNJ27308.1 hypothetical protein [Alienimonas chondri]
MLAASPRDDPSRIASRPAFAPTRAESGAVSVLVVALLMSAGVASLPVDDPTPHRSPVCRLDVNDASHAEWTLLRGVGPKLADRIVAGRSDGGAYRSAPDLLAVKGVGPKTFARLEPHLRFPSDGAPVATLSDGPTLAAR